MLLAGPSIGSLFTSANMAFTHKPKYRSKSFQHVRKRKRTISKKSGEDAASGIKKHKLDCDGSNIDSAKETLSGYNTSHHAVTQSEALDVSESYATAAESFDVSRDAVLKSPQHNVSKKNPPVWRKRKRYDDYMFIISKKKLKMNSDKIIKKSKIQNIHSKGNKTKTKGSSSFAIYTEK